MSRTWKDTKTARERRWAMLRCWSDWGWPGPGTSRFVKRGLSKARRRVGKFGERHSSWLGWESTANWKGW